MNQCRLSVIVIVICGLWAAGCDEEPEPPSQQAVKEDWKRADHAAQQSFAAQADVKRVTRLRDIDRLRHDADVANLSVQVTTLRSMTIGLSMALLAALIWLGVEIRRRRVLAAIVPFASPTDPDRSGVDPLLEVDQTLLH